MDIDIVITWVDGNDPEWQRERMKYYSSCTGEEENASVNMRYRDWDNLQYIFRGIDRYMPWVRTIHFVTWGHVPKWLNLDHPKLHIVKHSDFIPEEYLPTFNSNTIELNYHRIPGLADHFINFNDDMFVIKKTVPEDFFQDGLPCDMAVLSPQPIFRSKIVNIETNNLQMINDYFTPEDIKKNRKKWLKPSLYGSHALRTALFMNFSSIIGIFVQHIPYSHLKSVFEELWDKEYESLDAVSKHKFRSAGDLNVWLFREWQLLSGQFVPRSKNFGVLVPAGDIDFVKKALHDSKYKMVCINDGLTVSDFEATRDAVNCELQKLFPEPSGFER